MALHKMESKHNYGNSFLECMEIKAVDMQKTTFLRNMVMLYFLLYLPVLFSTKRSSCLLY